MFNGISVRRQNVCRNKIWISFGNPVLFNNNSNTRSNYRPLISKVPARTFRRRAWHVVCLFVCFLTHDVRQPDISFRGTACADWCWRTLDLGFCLLSFAICFLALLVVLCLFKPACSCFYGILSCLRLMSSIFSSKSYITAFFRCSFKNHVDYIHGLLVVVQIFFDISFR